MKFLTLFSGLDGFRCALESLGHKSVGWCELDKHAQQAYRTVYDCEGEWFSNDIRTADPISMPDFDLLTFGWPCQDNSIAGKRAGQKEGTRSGLLYEAVRILKAKRPSYFIAENVSGLFSVSNGKDFYKTIREFTNAGYDVQWQLLNTSWFLPQNRERIYFVGHLRGTSRPEVFPIGEDGGAANDIQKQSIRTNTITARYEGAQATGSYVIEGQQYAQIVAPVLTPNGEEIRQNGRQIKEPGEPMFTLTEQDRHGVILSGIYTQDSPRFNRGPLSGLSRALKANTHDASITDGYAIRRLTPLECLRLQGFPDSHYYKLKAAGISDSQIYKLAGNAVSVPVVKAIAEKLFS